MALRTWVRVWLTAAGVGLLAGAGQLGIAYGLGILRIARTFDGGARDEWAAQVAWAVWFAIAATVVGALAGDRMARRYDMPDSAAATAGVAGCAGLGAAIVAPLVMVPARSAVLPQVSTAAVVGGSVLIGVLVGLLAGVAVLLERTARWNVAAMGCSVWLLAVVSVAPSLGPTDPQVVARLGVLEPAWLDPALTPRMAVVLMPALALVAGAVGGARARRLGVPSVTAAVSAVIGPGLLAGAYLVAGPGDGANRFQDAAYWGALLAVPAGALGSLLAIVAHPAERSAATGESAGPDPAAQSPTVPTPLPPVPTAHPPAAGTAPRGQSGPPAPPRQSGPPAPPGQIGPPTPPRQSRPPGQSASVDRAEAATPIRPATASADLPPPSTIPIRRPARPAPGRRSGATPPVATPPYPVTSSPVSPPPVAPTPVTATPVAPHPVAPPPVAPPPVAPPPIAPPPIAPPAVAAPVGRSRPGPSSSAGSPPVRPATVQPSAAQRPAEPATPSRATRSPATSSAAPPPKPVAPTPAAHRAAVPEQAVPEQAVPRDYVPPPALRPPPAAYDALPPPQPSPPGPARRRGMPRPYVPLGPRRASTTSDPAVPRERAGRTERATGEPAERPKRLAGGRSRGQRPPQETEQEYVDWVSGLGAADDVPHGSRDS